MTRKRIYSKKLDMAKASLKSYTYQKVYGHAIKTRIRCEKSAGVDYGISCG